MGTVLYTFVSPEPSLVSFRAVVRKDCFHGTEVSWEFKDRAVRLAYEHQEVHVCSRWAAAQAIGLRLSVSPHSIMDWMKKDTASAKAGEGNAVDYAAENAPLRAENLELFRVNELLKAASAFFASEPDPKAGNDRIH